MTSIKLIYENSEQPTTVPLEKEIDLPNFLKTVCDQIIVFSSTLF